MPILKALFGMKWLSDPHPHMEFKYNQSFILPLIFDVLHGTVQGLILGPILYAIFVSPISDLEDISTFIFDSKPFFTCLLQDEYLTGIQGHI